MAVVLTVTQGHVVGLHQGQHPLYVCPHRVTGRQRLRERNYSFRLGYIKAEFSWTNYLNKSLNLKTPLLNEIKFFFRLCSFQSFAGVLIARQNYLFQ